MYSIGVTSSTKTRLIALRHLKDGCLKIEIKLSIECRMLVKFKIAFPIAMKLFSVKICKVERKQTLLN